MFVCIYYMENMWYIFCIYLLFGGYARGSVLRGLREVSGDLNEEMTSHLELLEMDYADRCSNLSKARRKVLMGDRDSYENQVSLIIHFVQTINYTPCPILHFNAISFFDYTSKYFRNDLLMFFVDKL